MPLSLRAERMSPALKTTYNIEIPFTCSLTAKDLLLYTHRRRAAHRLSTIPLLSALTSTFHPPSSISTHSFRNAMRGTPGMCASFRILPESVSISSCSFRSSRDSGAHLMNWGWAPTIETSFIIQPPALRIQFPPILYSPAASRTPPPAYAPRSGARPSRQEAYMERILSAFACFSFHAFYVIAIFKGCWILHRCAGW